MSIYNRYVAEVISYWQHDKIAKSVLVIAI